MFYLRASYYFVNMVTIQKTGGISAVCTLVLWPVCELQHYMVLHFPQSKKEKMLHVMLMFTKRDPERGMKMLFP